MINPLAALSIATGIAAITLGYIALATNDRNAQLLETIDRQANAQRNKTALQGATLDLMEECRLLEQRNDYLEAAHTRFRNIIAGAIMLAPTRRMATEKLTVGETQEAP